MNSGLGHGSIGFFVLKYFLMAGSKGSVERRLQTKDADDPVVAAVEAEAEAEVKVDGVVLERSMLLKGLLLWR